MIRCLIASLNSLLLCHYKMSNLRRRKPAEVNITRKSSKGIVKNEPILSLGLCSRCLLVTVATVGVCCLIAAYGYFKAPFTALSTTDISQPVEPVGRCKVNEELTKGVRRHGIDAPESFVEDENGYLYTGLQDGKIIRIAPSQDGVIGAGKVTNVTNGVIPDAPKSMKNLQHGRPLGLRLIRDTLFVADANYGIYSVNVETGEILSLVSPNIIEPKLMLVDDLSITSDGNYIYFSDGSAKHAIDGILNLLLEGVCDGRILQYNVRKKDLRTVASGLCFANGVQLSADESFLLVSETFKHRVRIIDVMTWKTLQFIDMPMRPDNIRPTGKGTYWVAGGGLPTSNSVFLEKYPMVRQIIMGLFSQETFLKNKPVDHNVLVEMTEKGEILQCLHDPREQLSSGLAQALTLSDGRIVLGSYIANFMAILDKKDVALGA